MGGAVIRRAVRAGRRTLRAAPAVAAAGGLLAWGWLGGARGVDPAAWAARCAPAVAALVGCALVAGRAAELARMRLDDQVDALRTMGGSALRLLVLPDLVGAAVGLALLAGVADAAGLAVAIARRLPAPAAGLEALGSGFGRAAVLGAGLAAVASAVGLGLRSERSRRAGLPDRAAAWGGAIALVALLALGRLFAAGLRP
jgi:hypothetical protein